MFSADDFSPRHPQLVCGGLPCVDYCASDLDAAPFDDANDSTNTNTNGMFGIRRKRMISYENTDDLTRKLDAFFHRKGSLDAAREIRNPVVEDNFNLRGHDSIIVDECEFEYEYEYEYDTASTRSTCPSTSPSSARGECYYPSCSYSYTNEQQGNRIHSSARAAPNNSSRPSITTTRPFELQRSNRDNRDDDDDDGSLPDFLKGVEFKKSCRRQRGKKLEVIALPFSPPQQPVVTSFPSSSPFAFHSNVNSNSNDVSFARNFGCSSARRNTNVVTDRQSGIEIAMEGTRVDRLRLEKGFGQNNNHKRHRCCLRRLGRGTKKWWKKLCTIRRRR